MTELELEYLRKAINEMYFWLNVAIDHDIYQYLDYDMENVHDISRQLNDMIKKYGEEVGHE